MPNLQHGIEVNGILNLIGGASPTARNLISGNTFAGIDFNNTSAGAFVPQITGNLIGTNVAGTGSIANGSWGILIENSVSTPSVITSNTVWNNVSGGIRLEDSVSNIRHRINQNSIYNNGGLGIDLGLIGVTQNDVNDPDSGSNRRQNFPVLTSVSSAGLINGSLDTLAANGAYPMRIEFFGNTACDPSGYGEGEVFLGFTTLAAPGNFSHTVMLNCSRSCITATATDNVGNTSEFSLGVTAMCPTAAEVSLSGMVATASGQGISKALVSLVKPNGEVLTVLTNSFGKYRFDNLSVGETYIISVNNKKYRFSPSSQIVTLKDNAADINFIADD